MKRKNKNIIMLLLLVILILGIFLTIYYIKENTNDFSLERNDESFLSNVTSKQKSNDFNMNKSSEKKKINKILIFKQILLKNQKCQVIQIII